jgi:hypothetical protein
MSSLQMMFPSLSARASAATSSSCRLGTRAPEVLLRELKQILSESSYVRTLLRDMARASPRAPCSR